MFERIVIAIINTEGFLNHEKTTEFRLKLNLRFLILIHITAKYLIIFI